MPSPPTAMTDNPLPPALPPELPREPTSLRPPRRRLRLRPWHNVVTGVMIVLTAALIVGLVFLWQNPYSALNPFAPNTPFPIVVSMTPSPIDEIASAPTATPPAAIPVSPDPEAARLEVTATVAPLPETTPTDELASPEGSVPGVTTPPEAALPTAIIVVAQTTTPAAEIPPAIAAGTPEAVAGTATFTPFPIDALLATLPPASAPTPEGGVYPFRLIPRGILYITNPPGRGGCAWSSIVGSVTDADAAAINGTIVRLTAGDGAQNETLSGSAPGFGPGGFEILLGSQAADVQYTIQLFGADGAPLSPAFPIVTSSDCTRNIAAARFIPS